MEKVKKFGFIVGIGLVLSGCGGEELDQVNQAANEKKEQTIQVSLPAQLSTLDTTQTTDKVTFTVVQHLFEGLFRLDDESIPVPGLAESVDISEDGKNYTFRLRDDITWSNGEPIVADDFLFAWKRLVNPETMGPNAYWLDNVVNSQAIRNGKADIDSIGLAAPDDQTFVVTLENPQPSFLSVVSIGWLAPQQATYVTEKGQEYAATSEDLLYSGPFILEDWDQSSDTWTLKKNDAYYDADKVKLTQVLGSTVKDENTGINLFDTGELDFTKISGQFVQQYQGETSLVSSLEVANYFLDFNQNANDTLANVHARKAIALAIDKEGLVNKVLADGSKALNGLIPAGLYSNAETGEDFRTFSGEYNLYDTQNAQQEWQVATADLGDEISLSLLVNDTDNGKKVAEYVQAQLQENLPGLTITINQQPANNLNQSRREGNYELSLSGWIAGSSDLHSYFNLYATGSAYNYGGYASSVYSEKVSQAITTHANQENQMFADFKAAEKELLATDAAQVPIYQSAANYLVNPAVKGIVYHAYGDYFNVREAYLEE